MGNRVMGKAHGRGESLIILKIFGQQNHMMAKFNRDKHRTMGMEVDETQMIIRNKETVIYYKSAKENLEGYRANLIETYGDGAIPPTTWGLIRRMLR